MRPRTRSEVVDLALGPGQRPVDRHRRQLAGRRLGSRCSPRRSRCLRPAAGTAARSSGRGLPRSNSGKSWGTGTTAKAYSWTRKVPCFEPGRAAQGRPLSGPSGDTSTTFTPSRCFASGSHSRFRSSAPGSASPAGGCLAGAVAGSPVVDLARPELSTCPERDDHDLLPLRPDDERHHPRARRRARLRARRLRLHMEVIDQVDQGRVLGQGRPDLAAEPTLARAWMLLVDRAPLGQLPLQFVPFGGAGFGSRSARRSSRT